MNEKIFDVAILAEGLNSLLTAYELSKAGALIALIDNYKPSFEIDGYTFDTYPGYVFSFNGLPNVFKQLNIPFETYVNPTLQLILPDRRVDIHSNVERCMSEIQRRFKVQSSDMVECLLKEQDIINLLSTLDIPNHTNAFNVFIKRLYTKRLLNREKKRVSHIHKQLLNDDVGAAFIMALQRHMFPWYSENAPAATIPVILQKRFYPLGGKSSIKNAIIEELIKQNAYVIQNKAVNNIDYKKHFMILFDHKETIHSKYIIADPFYETSLSLMSKYAYTVIKKKFYVDNIFIGIHRTCLPEPYNRANYAILISDYKKQLYNDNLIFIFNNPISDIKRAKDEMTALTISYLIPDNNISRLSAIRDATINHIKDFMPFFDDFVENIYFTEPYIIWDNKPMRLKKRIQLVNDEFLNRYTFDEKYAYIKNITQKIVP